MVDIKDGLEKRILILDGAMGTLIQSYGLNEQVFRGERFAGWNVSLSGNNEVLNLTAQEVVEDIHRRYIRAGADIITANTFSANRISQHEYGCEELASEMGVPLLAQIPIVQSICESGDKGKPAALWPL